MCFELSSTYMGRWVKPVSFPLACDYKLGSLVSVSSLLFCTPSNADSSPVPTLGTDPTSVPWCWPLPLDALTGPFSRLDIGLDGSSSREGRPYPTRQPWLDVYPQASLHSAPTSASPLTVCVHGVTIFLPIETILLEART